MHDLIRRIYSKLGHREANLFTFFYFRLGGNASMIDAGSKACIVGFTYSLLTGKESELREEKKVERDEFTRGRLSESDKTEHIIAKPASAVRYAKRWLHYFICTYTPQSAFAD